MEVSVFKLAEIRKRQGIGQATVAAGMEVKQPLEVSTDGQGFDKVALPDITRICDECQASVFAPSMHVEISNAR